MFPIKGKFPKLLILTAISLSSGLILSLLSVVFCSTIFNTSFQEVLSATSSLDSEQSVQIAKIVLLFNSLGLFLIPSIVFAKLFNGNVTDYLKLNRKQSISAFILLVFLFLSFLPLINVTVELNKALVLPEFLGSLENWIRSTEDNAMELTRSFLKMEGKKDLIYTLFLISILPAIGEELFFRGTVQQVLTKNTKNYHLGIWLAAFIFSAIHFQFYGFLPRLLLGAFFGYLFYWSNNLWLPILAHLLNNGIAVLAVYFLGENGMEEKLDKVGATSDTYVFSVLSLCLFIFLLRNFRKLYINPT